MLAASLAESMFWQHGESKDEEPDEYTLPFQYEGPCLDTEEDKT